MGDCCWICRHTVEVEVEVVKRRDAVGLHVAQQQRVAFNEQSEQTRHSHPALSVGRVRSGRGNGPRRSDYMRPTRKTPEILARDASASPMELQSARGPAGAGGATGAHRAGMEGRRSAGSDACLFGATRRTHSTASVDVASQMRASDCILPLPPVTWRYCKPH